MSTITTTNAADTYSIHIKPHLEGTPWYRPPPGVEKGPSRTHASIIGGLLIDNDEGRKWFKDTYNFELAEHHRQDMNIPMRLKKLIVEKNIDAYGCTSAPRRFMSHLDDFLVVTHIEAGPFVHDGPDNYEEVMEEDRRPKPGVREERVKEQLAKEFGITTSGYKSYYKDDWE